MKNMVCAVLIGLFAFSSVAYAMEWPEKLEFTDKWKTVNEEYVKINDKTYFVIYQKNTESTEVFSGNGVGADGIFFYSIHQGSFQTELVELLEFWMLNGDSKYTLFYKNKDHTPIFTPPGAK